MKLEEMEREIEKLVEIENYLARRDWRDFEAIVGHELLNCIQG